MASSDRLNPVVAVFALLLGVIEFAVRGAIVAFLAVTIIGLLVLSEFGTDVGDFITPYLWKAALDKR